ncbi:hypothetical protein [Actinoallomurus iriomotensis]|uniref:Uncharacterized protein n=1 Tax=Actinoallomurus iriomotensis TaxID=478107 RepID=A0A9W6RV12_9ACTN|nr:hypothetical protein [Actinoallomurus iriomotensis]GLY74161.1 hypothetical protein Airi01_024280 [Actinoallomurus iriomotensis]GLY82365.1 hypothetical protein Airi02_002970 [Actinoallomurus iriomotensis]
MNQPAGTGSPEPSDPADPSGRPGDPGPAEPPDEDLPGVGRPADAIPDDYEPL